MGLIFVAGAAVAQIPRTMSYQGVLTDATGVPVPTGTHSVVLGLYDAATGGTLLFTETQSIAVTTGFFSCIIGGATTGGITASLTFNNQYYLGVAVDGQAEMAPRTPLASAPYALNTPPQISYGYGDGSDGAVTTVGGEDWGATPPGQSLQFTDLTINGTVSVPTGTVIYATGTVTINGTINVIHTMATPNVTDQFINGFLGIAADYSGRTPLSGGGYLGGLARPSGQLRAMLHPGAGGQSVAQNPAGHWVLGGGVLTIRAAGGISISAAGTISAPGEDGQSGVPEDGESGAGGGFVILASKSNITNAGTINVRGGNASTTNAVGPDNRTSAGGGGGGIIHFLCPNALAVAGACNVLGGVGGPAAAAGSNWPVFGGGASGGNGGNSSLAGSTVPGDNGSPGIIFRTQVADPAFLFQ